MRGPDERAVALVLSFSFRPLRWRVGMAETRVTQTVLAERLGLSTARVRALSEGNEPVLQAHREGGRTWYAFPESVHRYLNYRISSEVKRRIPDELTALRTRKMMAAAAMAEMDLEARRCEMLPSKEARQAHDEGLEAVRGILAKLPAHHGNRLVGIETPGEAQQQLDGIVWDVMTELSDKAAPHYTNREAAR